MSSPNYTVYMVQGNTRVGEIEYTRLEVASRYLKKGRWEMTVEYLPDAVSWNSRIEVVRKGSQIFSGPFTSLSREWTYAETDDRHFVGTCDLDYIYRRFASPDPSLSTGPYSTQAADVQTDKAETVIRHYIGYNVGPNATVSRQQPGFTLATDLTRGGTVTGRARFDDLMTMCRDLALSGGVGFEVVGLQLRFYVPQDLRNTVIFSEELDNIESFEYHGAPPKANYVVVAGQGTGAGRATYEIGDALSIFAHGRRELFVDARNVATIAELAQQAATALIENGVEDLNLHVVPGPAAVESMLPYDNFYLGDRISFKVDDLVFDGQIQEIGIVDSQDTVREHITLGNFGKGARYVTSSDLLAALSKRIRRLETQ